MHITRQCLALVNTLRGYCTRTCILYYLKAIFSSVDGEDNFAAVVIRFHLVMRLLYILPRIYLTNHHRNQSVFSP